MPKDATLAIETSTPAGSIAVVSGEVLEERGFTSDRSHNALLFGPLTGLLEKWPAERIGRVLVGSGPGSYSGTRVGIAAAQGVAIAAGCPAVAVPSILALEVAEDGARYLVVGDARRGSFWSAGVAEFGISRGPDLTDAAGLEAAVAAAAEAGHPVVTFEEPGRFPLAGGLASVITAAFPTAAFLWRAWSEAGETIRREWQGAPPQPMYLKPPHITPAKRPWLLVP